MRRVRAPSVTAITGAVVAARVAARDAGRSDRAWPAPLVTFAVINVSRYYRARVIKTFKCADTQALARGERVKRFVGIANVARRKRCAATAKGSTASA
jgi:hypothetical protein